MASNDAETDIDVTCCEGGESTVTVSAEEVYVNGDKTLSPAAIPAPTSTSVKEETDSLSTNVFQPIKLVERRELVHYDDLYSEEFAELESGTSSVSEEESSDCSTSDSETILRTALTPNEREIKGYDVASTALPENGSQFLLKVQHERKTLPKTVNASKSSVEKANALAPEDDTKPFKVTKIPKCVATPTTLQEFLPTQSWMSIITHQFSNLSLKVDYWRRMMEAQGASITLAEGITLPPFEVVEKKWLPFCFGKKLCNQITSIPRQRKAVSSADSKVISTFFCDDVLTDNTVPIPTAHSSTVEILQSASVEDSLKELAISEPTEVKSENTKGNKERADQNDGENESSSLTSDSEDEEESYNEKQAPLLSILLNLPIPTIEDLLSMQIYWLNKYGWFHEYQGKWIYAILACLVRPLSADVISDIRKLVRICCSLRKRVCETKLATDCVTTEDDNKSSEACGADCALPKDDTQCSKSDEESDDGNRFQQFINTMNIFICLAGDYFQQFDLADTPRP